MNNNQTNNIIDNNEENYDENFEDNYDLDINEEYQKMVNKIEEMENMNLDENSYNHLNQIKIFLNDRGENITLEEITKVDSEIDKMIEIINKKEKLKQTLENCNLKIQRNKKMINDLENNKIENNEAEMNYVEDKEDQNNQENHELMNENDKDVNDVDKVDEVINDTNCILKKNMQSTMMIFFFDLLDFDHIHRSE